MIPVLRGLMIGAAGGMALLMPVVTGYVLQRMAPILKDDKWNAS